MVTFEDILKEDRYDYFRTTFTKVVKDYVDLPAYDIEEMVEEIIEIIERIDRLV